MRNKIIYSCVALMLVLSGCGTNNEKDTDIRITVENVCKIIMNAPADNYPALNDQLSEEENQAELSEYRVEIEDRLKSYMNDKAIKDIMNTAQIAYFNDIAIQQSLTLKVKEVTIKEGEDSHYEFATKILISENNVEKEETIKGSVQIEDGKITYFKITLIPERLQINNSN